jgi:hypothetical protein
MERVKRHLRRRLADALRRLCPDRLARLDQRAQSLKVDELGKDASNKRREMSKEKNERSQQKK